ncbi:MAG: isoprenoid biosynthesis glyoxalase ElbB [Myxococcales bacterium]|nr:isoprenoid biosynthesis glyoxalase ElbB [Myxococcales bacterium]
MTTAAVVLAGCGHMDGTEVREAVLALLALDREGVTVRCFAPDIPQRDVVDHLRKQPAGEARNVLVEAARIARGEVQRLTELDVSEFDLLVCPGGFGAAKNLSDLAIAGADATAIPEFAAVVDAFRRANKPICAICIAPAVIVAALGEGAVTIGNDPGTAGAIFAMGGTHVEQPVTGYHVDPIHRLVSTPAYMYGDARIGDIATGIERAIHAAVGLSRSRS